MPDYSVVSNVFSTYATSMDDHNFALLGSVFTEDAVFTVDITGGPTVGPFESRDAIVEFIESTTKEQGDQRRHVITNLRLDGNTAYTILTLLVTDNGELTAQSTGVYKVELREAGDSVQFSSMYLTLDRPY